MTKREYLLSILTSLTKPAMHPSPYLLLLHLHHLAGSPNSSELLITARSHATVHPSNPSLQKIRLEAEIAQVSNPAVIRTAGQSIIKAITRPDLSASDQGEAQEIWLLWANYMEKMHLGNGEDIESAWQPILRDSLRLGAGLPDLHPTLLGMYFLRTLQRDRNRDPHRPVPTLVRICAKYRPDPIFFSTAFTGLAEHATDNNRDLSKLYTTWRTVCRTGEEKVTAVLTWARWLMQDRKGREASSAVDVVRSEVRDDQNALVELESGWKKLLDGAERNGMEDGSSDTSLVIMEGNDFASSGEEYEEN